MAIQFRPGSPEDSFAVFQVFKESITDLGQRFGVVAIDGGDDPQVIEKLWELRRPLFDHLALTAERFWIAQAGDRVIGYARSIRRSGLLELTDFFISPGSQSAGVGRGLLARAFPPETARQDSERRVIIATTDSRALALYLKSGVYGRFPIYYFHKEARSTSTQPAFVNSDLRIEPMPPAGISLDAVREIDLALLGHSRDVDHAWLLSERRGFLYHRGGKPVGYGYIGENSGPFALLEETDFPAVLAHAENIAARSGKEIGVEAPLINRSAVDYLLAHGFKMSAFIALFMSDAPFGRFENYLFPSPPFFL